MVKGVVGVRDGGQSWLLVDLPRSICKGVCERMVGSGVG